MAAAITGTVHGATVVLDEAVPPLDGHRVRVVLERLDGDPSDSDVTLTPDDQQKYWREWETAGPQGPIDAPDGWPDEK